MVDFTFLSVIMGQMVGSESSELKNNPEKVAEKRAEQVLELDGCKFQAPDGRCRFTLFTGVNMVPCLSENGKCTQANNASEQWFCNKFNNVGKVFDIRNDENWSLALISKIMIAQAGDVVVVPSETMKWLGERTQARIKPQANIKFVVDNLI